MAAHRLVTPQMLALVLANTRRTLGMEPLPYPLVESLMESRLSASNLAAAPAQVPISAPLAPTGGANQPAAGALPQGGSQIVRDLITKLAQKYRLDPAAVMAVALGEGGLDWGAVGDGGHAFGPFQLNNAGGVITNRPGDHAAFANSPAGLEFAMRRMAESGAAGLTGSDAINSIIRRFERPADPDSSVRNALARLSALR